MAITQSLLHNYGYKSVLLYCVDSPNLEIRSFGRSKNKMNLMHQNVEAYQCLKCKFS
jgi:hypothetical protein